MDWDSLMDCRGAQSQKDGQEDQGTLKQLGGVPILALYLSLVLLTFWLWAPWHAITRSQSIKLSLC